MTREDSFSSDIFLLFFRDIVKYEVLSRKEEQKLFKLYKKNQDMKVKNKIILSNLRFVFQEANKFLWSDLSFLDIVEEGIIGLMRAIEKFDHRKHIRFISYAVWWIRQSIWDAIYSKGYSVKIPSNFRNSKNDSQKQKKINLLFQNLMNIIHYEKQVSSDSLKSLLSFLPARKELSPEYIEEDISLSKNIDVILNHLNVKERTIIKMRYGLHPYEKKSLQDIATFLNITKERVRQIQNLALNKLKTDPITPSLKYYLSD